MTIRDLSHDDQLALVGLVRLMIRLDGQFSAGEEQALDAVVQELGPDLFEKLAEEVGEKMQDEEAVKYYASRVADQEARELIYGTLFDLAIPDSIVLAEASLLSWLAERWGIDPRG
jgi:uncharacterized tellurite resistance protein B-like protein